MRNFLALSQLPLSDIEYLIDRTLHIKLTNNFPNLHNKYISNLFFENSTRTKISFEMAERKCGLSVIPFDPETSSMKKGETLYDTVKTLEAIGVDAVIIRDSQDAYYKQLTNIKIPIINAGDGTGDHPSQSLLDLVTIKEHFGSFENLHVTIVGDILHSRVAHSNINILKRLGVNIAIASPKEWYTNALADINHVAIDEIIAKTDIVMLLRIQHERHSNTYHDKINAFLDTYGLTEQRMSQLKNSSIVMHPAPVNRDVEIADSLVEHAKSKIFPQMTNGMYARCAILEYIFS